MSLLINWVCVLVMKVQGNCIYMILIENRYESSPVREMLKEVPDGPTSQIIGDLLIDQEGGIVLRYDIVHI